MPATPPENVRTSANTPPENSTGLIGPTGPTGPTGPAGPTGGPNLVILQGTFIRTAGASIQSLNRQIPQTLDNGSSPASLQLPACKVKNMRVAHYTSGGGSGGTVTIAASGGTLVGAPLSTTFTTSDPGAAEPADNTGRRVFDGVLSGDGQNGLSLLLSNSGQSGDYTLNVVVTFEVEAP